MRQLLHAPMLSVLATALAAQTFVVDLAGGAGAHFTSIAAAAAAVPNGAVLRVRPGDYVASVLVLAKGLTILGEPNATIVSPPAAPRSAKSAGSPTCKRRRATCSWPAARPLAPATCSDRAAWR